MKKKKKLKRSKSSIYKGEGESGTLFVIIIILFVIAFAFTLIGGQLPTIKSSRNGSQVAIVTPGPEAGRQNLQLYTFIGLTVTPSLTPTPSNPTVLPLSTITLAPSPTGPPTTVKTGVSINPDRTISINGTRFFPIGAYTEADYAGSVGLGLNSVSDPFCVNTGAIAKCESNKAYCHLTVGPACDNENAQAIKSRNSSVFISSVNQLKGSSYLLGYGLPDEPMSSEGLSSTDTKWAYDTIKNADPNHLVFFTDYASDVSSYKNSADVFLNDEYPFYNDPNPMYDIKSIYQKMLSQVSPKPAWLIIQTGGANGVPTNVQIRAETYLSIALGSTGIIFYSYDVTDAAGVHNIKKDGDPLFMKNLISELKSFSPYFLASTSNNLLYSSSDVDAILKDYSGKSYLIAVNKNASSKGITFTISGKGNSTGKILGTAAAGSTRAGQNITITGGKLTDTLQGLEAVVYEIN